jgi:prevent-host-death family protein
MPTVVNMHDAKSSLSRLVKRAAAGEEILIANHGKPVAMLTRIPAARTKIPWDVFKGKIKMADDFDAPLEDFKDYV